jgi:hypothetical protein
MSTSATIKSPPTILLHFQLHLIQHIAHFTIVEQLMAEYYHAGDCRLLVMDMPFNVGHDEALDKWNLDAMQSACVRFPSTTMWLYLSLHTPTPT